MCYHICAQGSGFPGSLFETSSQICEQCHIGKDKAKGLPTDNHKRPAEVVQHIEFVFRSAPREKEIMLNRNFKRVNDEVNQMIAELLGIGKE